MRRLSLLLVLMFTVGCASAPAQKARTVSVNVHTTLAAVDDVERALCNPQPDRSCQSAVAAWTTAKHQEFSKHLIIALQAGKSLNEGVRVVPVGGTAKADLALVSAELNVLSGLVEDVLPPTNPVRIYLGKAITALLQILPIFLE